MKPTIITLRGIFSFLIVAAAFLISSCNKEPDAIGLDLLPAGDKLKVGIMDTATIVATSVYDNAVRTDELVTKQAIIGNVYDPIFGKTSGSFYTQFQLSTVAPTFGTNPVCDSMVLVLPYTSLFGDATALQTFKVYELSEALALDSVYYSNMHAQYNVSSLLAEQTFRPRVNDSIRTGTTTKKIAPQLRLKFDKALGSRMLAASTNDLLTSANFIQFFKGIAIIANEQDTPGKGSIVSFNLASTYTALRMYYHNTADTAVYDFVIGSSCALFNQYNHYGHTEASADFKAQLSGDTSLGQQKLYIQALGGTKIKLRFPYLKQWASNQKIVINQAELIMTNADSTAPYGAPALLGLRVLEKNGTVNFTTDEQEGSGYFDGNYNPAKKYRFRISRYVQSLLLPKTDNYGLYLFVPNTIGTNMSYHRLILGGTNKQLPGRMKLEVRYTVVPN